MPRPTPSRTNTSRTPKPRTTRLPGMLATDHHFQLPLDHQHSNGEQITVFARELVATARAKEDLPWLLFLQGGPGSGSPRPITKSGWIKRALEDYRICLLDQRGTASSSRLCAQSLARFESADECADYLSHFRADAIVRDAESIRSQLTGGKPWTLLGQSFGGFCSVHYLSAAPEGLTAAAITGGLPSLDRPADDVYRATYERLKERNLAYYERYPEDVQHVREIVGFLEENDVRLPCGARLKPRMLQQLGLAFGMSDGFESIHYLLEQAWVDGAQGRELSYAFLHGFEHEIPYQTHPVFAILHEAIYNQGDSSRWAAERLGADLPEFATDADPFYFTGEMIYRSMFEDYPQLQPLAEAAELIAQKDDWPHLYDTDRLQSNTVPVAAAIYTDDMYVERQYSEETAHTIGNVRTWITSEYDHNGLRADGEKLLGRLLDMIHNEC